MLDLFMTLTSKFQTAIAAETITCLQFALTNRKGKETLKARVFTNPCKAAPEMRSCFSPKLYADRRAHHASVSICLTEISIQTISAIAVSAMGQKKREGRTCWASEALTTRQQLTTVCYFASLADG